MTQSVYRERDYTFGQLIQKLRIANRLTQNGLAEYLGISRRAIGNWEAGSSYPQPHLLKRFIELGIENQVFSTGDEAEEIRLLWSTARQKLQLDETWLAGLLSSATSKSLESDTLKKETTTNTAASSTLKQPELDWGEAPANVRFYGRETELAELKKWVIEERCRVVGLLGLAGIGKSALGIHFMRTVASYFEVVMWRSLKSASDCQTLLDDCLFTLLPEARNRDLPHLEKRLSLLLEQLQKRRILLVLDNSERVLEKYLTTNRSYEHFCRLLRRLGETAHQSCLIFSSREKPDELIPLEGYHSGVRVLRLTSLDVEACQQLLAEKNIKGSASELTGLIKAYGGNPLALKIAGQTIVDLFGGELAPFLDQNQLIFGGLRELLNEQFRQLSPVEQTILVWFAIMREPLTLDDLQKVLITSLPRLRLLEAIEFLYHQSLIERGQKPGTFILQPVVLEFVTARFISEACLEVESGNFQRLIEHSIALAQVPDYIRQNQLRFLVKPIFDYLLNSYFNRAALETHLLALLEQIKAHPQYNPDYTESNLAILLQLLRENLDELVF
jgi:transcriptional regulator with XRE-family HTH domain